MQNKPAEQLASRASVQRVRARSDEIAFFISEDMHRPSGRFKRFRSATVLLTFSLRSAFCVCYLSNVIHC